MEKERKIKLMVRWSIFTAGSIALFWFIWYLVIGSVPVADSVMMMAPVVDGIKMMAPKWTIQIPFGISRWWDILIGPIWSIIFISIFTNEKNREDVDVGFGLLFGLFFGLFFGLVLGLVFGLVYVLVIGLAGGLLFGLVGNPGAGLVFGLIFGLGVCLSAGLIFGLGACLSAGLGSGMLKLIFSKSFWRSTTGNWLSAKNA